MKQILGKIFLPILNNLDYIINFGKNIIKNIFNKKDVVISNNSLDENSTLIDINKINNDLKTSKNDFKREIGTLVLELGNQLFHLVADSLNTLSHLVKDLGLETIFSKTTKRLVSFIKNDINEKLNLKLNNIFSLDNEEIIKILSLDPCPLKDNKFLQFKMKIYDEIKEYALENIKSEILSIIDYIKSSKDIKVQIYNERFEELEIHFNDIIINKIDLEQKYKQIRNDLKFNNNLLNIIEELL